MSGPPPWTTIGFRPTYLSSTTSRAKSSRSAGSVIAAPPYLITTVLPWNSRMYGRASRRVPTSRTRPPAPERPPRSRRVLRVDRHVVVREVGEEHLGLRPLPRQPHGVLDLRAAHGLGQGGRVVGQRAAAGAYLHVLDPDVERQRRHVVQRAADRLRDPAPVRVAAVQSGLDQRRVGDRARRAHDRLL